MEPSDGHFGFAWLDRAIALAAKHHIAVVLGTPTAATAAWLTCKYPDTLRVDEDGRRAEHGNRQQFSFTSPRDRQLASRIALEMAKRYGHNRNVIGWQLDNELAAPSFDVSARIAFHHWLKKKYGTIYNLNEHWATSYWSQTYDSFEEVPVHSKGENPALLLDWKHFVTDTWISFLDAQMAVVRANSDHRQFATTNTMHWNAGFDHYLLHQHLEIVTWDDYFPDGHLDPILNAAEHDLVRGYKRKDFWVMETQPGFVNWGTTSVTLPRGVIREMAWQAVGHLGSVLGADGLPNPVYPEIQQVGADFAVAGPALADTTIQAPVAILQSYDSHWAIDFQKHTRRLNYVTQITELYRAIEAVSQAVDIVSPDIPLSSCKVAFAPALNVLSDTTAQHLLDYVRDGGHLVLGPHSGMKDEYDALQPIRQPGPLAAALGGHVQQFYALTQLVPITGRFGSGFATIRAEQLTATSPDTKVLTTYATENDPNEWLAGYSAAISHAYGNGTITYVGATLDSSLMRSFVAATLESDGVHPILAGLPSGVELMQRSNPSRRIWIIINHNTLAESIDTQRPGVNLLTGRSDTTIRLPPHGVAVFALRSSE